MGHVIHNLIVVTSWKAVDDARAEAMRLGLPVSPISESPINGYRTFCVMPIGSKFGWKDDEDGRNARAQFKSWLRLNWDHYYFEWCEVCYGDDDREASVVDSQWAKGGDHGK